MAVSEAVMILAMAFTSSLAGFTYAAQSRNWPVGAIFRKSWPTTMAAIFTLALVANVLFLVISSDLSWLLLVAV